MSLGKQGGIEAKSITKPIQLLAAWLVGLIFVNGTFLMTAQSLISIEWLAASLVIASIANVPIFLVSLFLLQTKFRAEIQEDHYYSQYLKDKLGRDFQSKPEIVELPIIEAEEVIDTGLWSDTTVMFNPHLKISDLVKQCLENSEIPITKEFGQKNWIPEFVVGIGRYLTYDQVSQLLTSLNAIKEIRVAFANDDDTLYEWDKTVLIGSYYYDVKDKSLSISEAISELHKTNGDVRLFYNRLFDIQRDDY
ncbi:MULTISPECIES: hypothetical protein [Shewanella]|uniref:hypothetical protein n=1 Tax=Shewanella TaxID=22 RepID=UPI001F4BF007|nr:MULTISPECIES: hypothetical protein [Shewanella]MCH7423622.1 hypothetical protein [Shewanella sp. MM_2022_3]MDI5874369.1 hypothetical protein [Shewanella xiamenensis]